MQKIDFKRVITKSLTVGGAAVGATIAYKKIAPGMNGKIKAAVITLAGAALPEFNRKSKLMDDAGSGVIAAGAIALASQFIPTVMAGVGEEDLAGVGAENAVEFDLSQDNVKGVEGLDNGIGAIDDVEDTSY